MHDQRERERSQRALDSGCVLHCRLGSAQASPRARSRSFSHCLMNTFDSA